MPSGYSTIEINATLEDLKPPNPFPFNNSAIPYKCKPLDVVM